MSDKGPRLFWDILGEPSQGLLLTSCFGGTDSFPSSHTLSLRSRMASVQLSEKGEAEITKKSFREGAERAAEGRIGTPTSSNARTHTRARTLTHTHYRDVLAMDSTIASTASNCLHREHALWADRLLQLSFHSVGGPRLFVWQRSALIYFQLVCSCAFVSGSAG